MKYWLLFIFSGLLVHSGVGQATDTTSVETVEVEVATEANEEDSISVPLKVFKPQFFVDYGKILLTAITPEQRLEGGVVLLFFEKFEAVGEFGKGVLKPEHSYVNGNYQATGDYFKLGGGYITKFNQKSSIGLGVRYGLSSFSDQGRIEIQSESGLQDDFELSFARNNLSARWWEVVLTSESDIAFNKSKPESKTNDFMKIGFFFRMKFLVAYDDKTDPVEVYSVPGYGSVNSGQQAVFNFFIKFHL
ncbi:MAG: DUF6048 family protein [Cyclobacteriaceae bacterium]